MYAGILCGDNMPRVPKGKKILYVYLDKNVYKQLWDLIRRKYPDSTYGALSVEVEHAIVSWIHQHNTTLHTESVNPRPAKSHQYAQEIMQYLRLQGYTQAVDSRMLRETISKIRGSDERTIRKWIKFLLENGFIKRLNPYIYEIV